MRIGFVLEAVKRGIRIFGKFADSQMGAARESGIGCGVVHGEGATGGRCKAGWGLVSEEVPW